jgi:hypothetical protein
MIFSLFVISAWANFATVTLVKGDVTKLIPHSTQGTVVNKGDQLPIDTSIRTGEKSLVKLNLNDGSTMNLGPNSKIILSNLSNKDPSMINLLTGMIKAEVNKKGTEEKKEGDIKMLVKSRTAVMGVRGTKFQSTFNPVNNNTSLVTVEGEVAMAKIKKDPILAAQEAHKPVDQSTMVKDLEATIEKAPAEEVTSVKPGQYSAVSEVADKPIEPVKIAPQQFEAIAETMGETNAKAVEVAADASNVKPGGFVDFETGIYVPPAADAKFDEKNQVYVAENIGKVDEVTGDYIPPEGIVLDAKKGFLADENAENKEEVKEQLLAMNTQIQEATPTVIQIDKKEIEEENTEKKYWLAANLGSISEKLDAKTKYNNKKATFLTESGSLVQLGVGRKFSEKWSGIFHYTAKRVEFEKTDGQNYNESEGSTNLDGYALNGNYQLNSNKFISFGYASEKYAYLYPSSKGESQILINSGDISTINIGYNSFLYETGKFQLFYKAGALALMESTLEDQTFEQGFGLDLALMGAYKLSSRTTLNPLINLKTLNQKAEDIEYSRSVFNMQFDFNWTF